jgi:hypothetical protein
MFLEAHQIIFLTSIAYFMNEPINTTTQPKRFTGKSHNQNPLWHNQPLRLTPAQTEYPESALDEFFQCYHLQDVRPILWQWLTEVVSSPRDSANDPHERKNHIFFYEKIESLIEAAWVMRRGNNHQIKPESKRQSKRINTLDTNAHKNDQQHRFYKPARLIEKVTSAPVEVITEVFEQATLSDLIDYLLPNWLRVALVNTQSSYSSGNGREILYDFYEQLVPFVTQLYIMSENRQLNNPTTLFTDFFQQCPINYIRRELADFLEAGIGHDGSYPNGFSPWQAWMAYNYIHCLTEAAYQLYIDQQKQAVLDAHTALTMELEEIA